jgi:predicted MFS family arabinose efflux permease
VSDTIGWRWVFLGVVALVVVAMVMVVPAMREIAASGGDESVGWSFGRLGWSVLLAVAVLALGVSGELPSPFSFAAAVVALVVALVAARPLLPPRSLRGGRGLPSVILLRAVIAGAYFGAEVYLPYLLTTQFHLSPALAGLSLTGAGIAWGGASLLQGRAGNTLGARAAVRLGIAGVVIAIVASLITALFGLPVWIAIVGWAVGGAGMGTIIPRLSVLMLAYSDPTNQGFNSAALSIADAVGPSVALAIAGILFASITTGGTAAFSGVFFLVLAIAVAAFALSGRVTNAGRYG